MTRQRVCHACWEARVYVTEVTRSPQAFSWTSLNWNEIWPHLKDSFFSSSALRIPQTLILQSCNLGDSGCMKLFERIVTLGRQTKFSDSAAVYCNPSPVQGVPLLEHLDIGSNGISGTTDLAQALVSVMQNNSIKFLNLSNNPLSSDFREAFLVSLLENKFNSLRVLKLDATGLTVVNVRTLATYLASSACKLLRLSIASNAIISEGCRVIVNGLGHCRSLERLDWDKNEPNVSYPSHNHGLPAYSALNGQFLAHKVRVYINRNLALKSQMSAEARELLRASRILLLNSPTRVSTSFWSLPPELKQVILSQLAPTLSPRQHALVFYYASDKTTLAEVLKRHRLPPLLPTSTSQADGGAPSRSIKLANYVNLGSGKKFGSLLCKDTGTKAPGRPLFSTKPVNPTELTATPLQVSEDRRRKWLEIVECELCETEQI
ncbi:hypothetical protein CPB83DRAFT_851617 [Crepidotus variabilis]|uniref:RNI-like protein n=1 Tax=Crepidotus variabilis TaxID=179855 RepID=A0A9P6JQX1_9AGAR|nr:hypothetical protein CPB83DRAFT_851617 [Crepidotus variabilis]